MYNKGKTIHWAWFLRPLRSPPAASLLAMPETILACILLGFHPTLSQYPTTCSGISARTSLAKLPFFMHSLNSTNWTISLFAIFPLDPLRRASSESSYSIYEKSASPTPTMMILAAICEASQIKSFVLAISWIVPSVMISNTLYCWLPFCDVWCEYTLNSLMTDPKWVGP